MSDRIQISITATENASRVFGQVGQAAQEMGRQVDDAADLFQALTTQYGMTEDAAREMVAAQGLSTDALTRTGAAATDAAADIRELGTATETVAPAMTEAAAATTEAGSAAESSGASWESLRGDLMNIGAAAGVAAAGLSLVGQAARDHEIAVRTIGATYGENAAAMVAFADQIQATTNFSNDAALKSANIAATLARNYGFTFQEIQQVLTISADLAATVGFTMEDATYRVVAALRGEAEAAEQLGLTMNQAAIDHDNVTLSMSNQEAGHFRLNALIDQSSFAMGEAATQADTTYGALTELGHGLQDAAVSAGEMLGPFGELGAYMADNALQSVLMGAGLTQLARGAASARTAITALAATHASVALLTSAIGPLGLVAAAGLAGIAIYKFAESIDGVMVTAVDTAEEKIGDLEETMRSLYATGSSLATIAERGTELFPGLVEATARMEELQTAISTTNAGMGQFDEEARAIAEGNLERWNNELYDLAQQFGSLDESMNASVVSTNDVAAATDALNSILQNTSAGAADQQAAAIALIDAYDAGKISAQELVDNLILLGASTEQYDGAATRAAAATEELTTTLGMGADAALKLADSLSESMSLANRGLFGTRGMLTEFELWESKLTDVDKAALDLADTLSTSLADAGRGLMGTRGMLNEFELWESQLTDVDTAALDLADSLSSSLALASRGLMGTGGMLNEFELWESQLEDTDIAALDLADTLSTTLAQAGQGLMGTRGMLNEFELWESQLEDTDRAALELADTLSSTLALAGRGLMGLGGLDDIRAEQAAAAMEEAAQAAEELRTSYAELVTEGFNAAEAAATQTATTMDNVFRVIVSNTEAVKSSSQAIFDWAEELIAAEGVWSRLDELLDEGTITGQHGVFTDESEYAQAQRAFNLIEESTAAIDLYADTIQAKLAPAVAEAQARLADYYQQVSQGTDAEIMQALAWADSATAAQALSTIVTGIELGRTTDQIGEMVVAAAALDPALYAIYESLGLVSTETDALTGEKTIVFHAEGLENISTETGELTDAITELTGTLNEILMQITIDGIEDLYTAKDVLDDMPDKVDVPVTITPTFGDGTGGPSPFGEFGDGTGGPFGSNFGIPESVDVEVSVDITTKVGQVDTSALDDFMGSAISPLGYGGGGLAAFEVTAKVGVDTSDFDSGINDASSRLSAFGGESATATADANNDAALSAIDAAGDALSGWGDSSATAQALAENSQALGAISAVSGALDGLNGKTATTYINTVYTTTYNTVGSAPPIGLGGVAGYAAGGVVAEMAEWGPEMLHFPNGGVAIAPTRGLYNVPMGTYVDTAPATAVKMQSMGSGFTFINNGTIIGIPDLERQITRTISEGLQRASSIHRSSFA